MAPLDVIDGNLTVYQGTPQKNENVNLMLLAIVHETAMKSLLFHPNVHKCNPHKAFNPFSTTTKKGGDVLRETFKRQANETSKNL